VISRGFTSSKLDTRDFRYLPDSCVAHAADLLRDHCRVRISLERADDLGALFRRKPFPCFAPASAMPAALAILPTVVLLTPLIFRATYVALGLSSSSPIICAYISDEIPRRPRAALPAVSSP
jgi:hypothetical protein